MQAAVIRKYGEPKVLRIENMPEPQPRAGEVKIRVMCSSVNPVDWKVRSGSIAVLSGWRFPRILGADFSGEVVACGAGVTDHKPGDWVYGFSSAIMQAGAYAEYMCCPVSRLGKKPHTLSHTLAAAVPLAGSTAYQALYKYGNLQPGMRVLVTGATGGVGHFAVQIAKAAGCEVYGVCHSRNAELARTFGCDEVLPYDRIDHTRKKQRYDIIFDAAAKYGYFACRSRLADKGTFVTTLPMFSVMVMHAVSVLSMGRKGRFVPVAGSVLDLQKLAELCDAGSVKPFVENVFPLSRIADAHTLSETEKVRGKIVITVQ